MPNLQKQTIIELILYTAKNSLQDGDQRRPCTWKGFQCPKQRPLQLFLSWTSAPSVWTEKNKSVDATDCVLWTLSKASDCCVSFKRLQRLSLLSIAWTWQGQTSFLSKKETGGKTHFLFINNSVPLVSILTRYQASLGAASTRMSTYLKPKSHIKTQVKCGSPTEIP